jgi:hypothetical protein
MENYQQADGRIEIPEVLRPYMKGQNISANFCLQKSACGRFFYPLLIPGNNPFASSRYSFGLKSA